MSKERLLPFIFARLISESNEAFDRKIKDWVVIIAIHDLTTYNCGWMQDEEMGKVCYIPSVDISKEDHVFSTFEEARAFVKQWWINN